MNESSDRSYRAKEDRGETEERGSKYQEGQMLRFIRVRFPGHAHSHPFIIGRRQLPYGQKVMALSDRGMALGYVNSFPYEVPYQNKLEPVRTISRMATENDESSANTHQHREKEMEDLCKGLIKKNDLEMNLTHVELTGHGKKVVFYFTAPQRVDFRGLVKDLISELRMRVELRQINARERASALGGLGPCGRALCCSSFLDRYGNVSIKMAKVQNLSLVASKLNGLCGQLKCCLSYEEEVYQEKSSRLPKENQLIKTANGDQGKVLRLHTYAEQFDMLTDRGVIRRYDWQQFNAQNHPLPPHWKMPERFEHTSQETSQIIGPPEVKELKESPEKKLKEHKERDINKDRRPSPPPKENDKRERDRDRDNSKSKNRNEKKSSAIGLEQKVQKNNPFNKRRRSKDHRLKRRKK